MYMHTPATPSLPSPAVDLQFLLAAASRAATLVPVARPEHLTNIIWGFARLGHSPASGRFTLKLCAHVGSKLREYGGELVGAVLWALAKLQYTPSGWCGSGARSGM